MKCLKIYLLLIFSFGINFNALSQDKNIKIKAKRNADNSVDFFYSKKKYGTYYLEFQFRGLRNSNGFKKKLIIKDKSGFLFNLQPTNRKKRIVWESYRSINKRGNPKLKVDTTFNYVLPFRAGKNISVTLPKENTFEKYFGKKRPDNWVTYAVKRDLSDTIVNMRKGLVVFVRNKYDKISLEGKASTTKANMIVVEHSDASLAYYFGFKKNQIFVKEGEIIYPQEKLGLLSKPYKDKHLLNFYIQYLTKDRKTYSIKVKYLNPYFYSKQENFQIENNKNYTVEFNEDIFFKEFSRKEKKKYLKK